MILSWFENRPSDEIPDENMWEDPKALEEWWERVRLRKKYSQGRSNMDPEQIDEQIVQNDLVKQFKE